MKNLTAWGVDRARRLLSAALASPVVDTYARDATQLAAIVDATCDQLDAAQQNPHRVNAQRDKRTCNWYIPPFENAFYGGIMTILRTADFLKREAGMAQRFILCGAGNEDAIRKNIAAAFPLLGRSQIIVLNNVEAFSRIPPSDYSFATLWTTAYVLLGINNTGLKFYFIQDYEPLFYPAGSTYAQSEATYNFGFHAICNTEGVRDSVEAVSGQKHFHFVPQVDGRIFHHTDDSARSINRKRLFFYARPGHPRNAFELGVSSLTILKKKMGDTLDIVVAGDTSPAPALAEISTSLGLLPYEKTAELYRSCHAGLAFMMTRHPSYLPFELMACGAVVVANRNAANAWFMKDRENCLLAPATASCVAQTLELALTSDWSELRRRASASVAEKAGGSWDAELMRILDYMESKSDN